MQQEGKYCACSAPCVRVMYEPSLSYSQISKFNVQKMMLPRPEQHKRVFGKFIKSREVSQVVVEETRAADIIQISKIVNITKEYEPLLMKSSLILMNNTYVMEKYGVWYPYEAVANTATFMMSNFMSFISVKVRKRIEFVYEVHATFQPMASNLIHSLYSFISVHQGISKVFSPWQNCLHKNITTSPSCDETRYGTELYFKKSAAKKLTSINVNTYTEQLDKIKKAYMGYVEELFSNTTYDVTKNPNHHKCLETIDNVNKTIYDHILLIETEFNKYSNTSSVPEQLNSTITIYYSYLAITRLMESTVTDACAWFNFDEFQDQSVLNDLIMSLLGLKQHLTDIKSTKSTIDLLGESLLYTYFKTLDLTKTLQAFLSTNITKTELATYVNKFTTIQLITDIMILQTEISRSSEYLMKSLRTVNDTISAMCDELFNFKLPVMDDKIINAMPLIIYAKNSTNNNYIKDWLARMRENRDWYFKSVSTGMLGIHYDYMEEAISVMIDYGKKFTSAMTEIRDNIVAFKDGNKMDTSFFK